MDHPVQKTLPLLSYLTCVMFVSPAHAHTLAAEVAHTLIVTRQVMDDVNWRRARVNPLSGGRGKEDNLPPSSTNERGHLCNFRGPKKWGRVFAQGIRVAFSHATMIDYAGM